MRINKKQASARQHFNRHTLFVMGVFSGALCLNIDTVMAANISDAQLKALLKEIHELKAEVGQLKKELNAHRNQHPETIQKTIIKIVKQPPEPTPAKSTGCTASPCLTPKNPKDNPFTLGGIPIVINPNLGYTPAYDGSDLLTNLSQQNGDLLVLQYRQELENTFADIANAQ